MDVDRELEAWRPFAYAIARNYFVAGGDRDDVKQEAMIALLDALRRFDPDRGASFKSFAALVIARRLKTAVRMALAGKHAPLNQSVRGAYVVDDQAVDVVELVPDRAGDVADVVDRRLELAALGGVVRELSRIERTAITGFANGRTYAAIAGDLGLTEKAVDNAIQRARRKARVALDELAA